MADAGIRAADGHVEARGLVKSYRRGSETIQVLGGLDLTVHRGGFVALMGPSGSGKTTLLNLVGGLDTPDRGTIRVAGEETTGLKGRALAAWRARHVGFVFQSFNLIPVLTAFRNVELPLLLTRLGRSERRRHAVAALALVGLSDRMDHVPRQLSGGQEQRVAIARAIVSDPDLLLCDEPTGDLDRGTSDEIMALLRRLADEHDTTIVMVTHDPRAASFADSVLQLDKGVIAEPAA